MIEREKLNMTWPPDKSWLASQYLLPPHGLGRSCPDIGKELGVSKYTIQRLVKRFEIWQPSKDRRVFMRKGKPTHWLEPPSRDEISRKYLLPPGGEGMTIQELASDYGVSVVTIRKWLKKLDITQDFCERHSRRMSGEGNQAYSNGNSHRYVMGQLLKKDKDKKCSWCESRKNVQIHHIDHNTENNDLSNLMWLCGHCNCLEAHLFALMNSELATARHIDNKLEITFTRRKK